MVLFPDAVRKAQLQIDTVVGRSRFPTAEDKPNLPYVEAMVREVCGLYVCKSLSQGLTIRQDPSLAQYR